MSNIKSAYSFSPIGVIHSCFKEKFGIPRQAGLADAASGAVELLPPYNAREALRGLEDFSHIWIVFVFHALALSPGKMTVRPPRLGGNQRLGVFATRSGFRPNPIGFSVVALDRIDAEDGRLLVHFRGGDMLDGTPVLDIKPYLPYADALPHAGGGFAAQAPADSMAVEFAPEALRFCHEMEAAATPRLMSLIEQLLRQDPRPAYHRHRSNKKRFGFKLCDFEVQLEIHGKTIRVIDIRPSCESDYSSESG